MARINKVHATEKEPSFHRSKAFTDIMQRSYYKEHRRKTRSLGTLQLKSFKREPYQSIQYMNSFHPKNIDKIFLSIIC